MSIVLWSGAEPGCGDPGESGRAAQPGSTVGGKCDSAVRDKVCNPLRLREWVEG